MRPNGTPLVSTIQERCRVCYTCVRECPAKAIRIADRQAEVGQAADDAAAGLAGRADDEDGVLG